MSANNQSIPSLLNILLDTLPGAQKRFSTLSVSAQQNHLGDLTQMQFYTGQLSWDSDSGKILQACEQGLGCFSIPGVSLHPLNSWGWDSLRNPPFVLILSFIF